MFRLRDGEFILAIWAMMSTAICGWRNFFKESMRGEEF